MTVSFPFLSQSHPAPSPAPRNVCNYFPENPSSDTPCTYKQSRIYIVSHSPSYFPFAFSPYKNIFKILHIRKEFLHSLLWLHHSSVARCPIVYLTRPLLLNIPTSITNNASMNDLNISFSSCGKFLETEFLVKACMPL